MQAESGGKGLVVCKCCETWVELGKVHNCMPKVKPVKNIEDEPLYHQMIMKQFEELMQFINESHNVTDEDLCSIWQGRVRVCKMAAYKALKRD